MRSLRELIFVSDQLRLSYKHLFKFQEVVTYIITRASTAVFLQIIGCPRKAQAEIDQTEYAVVIIFAKNILVLFSSLQLWDY